MNQPEETLSSLWKNSTGLLEETFAQKIIAETGN